MIPLVSYLLASPRNCASLCWRLASKPGHAPSDFSNYFLQCSYRIACALVVFAPVIDSIRDDSV
jgi:hypothetical protein